MCYPCTGAPRVLQFSNPYVYYNGYETGIAYETDPANSADTSRSMNETADTVSAFRGDIDVDPPRRRLPRRPHLLTRSQGDFVDQCDARLGGQLE